MSNPEDAFVNFEKDFELLDQSLSEPVVNRAAKNALEYNELLLSLETTDSEQLEIVQSLDESVAFMIGQHVNVSGRVTYFNKENTGHHTVYLDEHPVFFNGFCISKYVEGNKGTVVRYALQIPAIGLPGYEEVDEDEYGSVILGASAEIETTQFEYSIISPERAEAHLRRTNEELLEEVDAAIYNAHGTEGASLVALQGLALHDHLDLDTEMNRVSLAVYINKLIDIDAVPYVIHIDGPTLVYKEGEGNALFPIQQEIMVYAGGLTAQQYFNDDNELVWRMCLRTIAVADEKEDETVELHIPLESIKEFESIRSIYYGRS